MANTNIQSHRKPRRIRVPTERADGLSPEFTAQPHALSDDLVAAIADDAGSLDPEDMGSRFLSEAVEQGDLTARDTAEREFALQGDPDELERPSTELGAWSRMVDLAVQGGGASAQLQEAASYGADRLDAERAQPRDPAPNDSVSLADASIREVSLLDHEGPALDETIAPNVDLEEIGRHSRSTSREPLGEQVRGSAAEGGGPRGKQLKRAGSKLRKAAGKLKSIAKHIAR